MCGKNRWHETHSVLTCAYVVSNTFILKSSITFHDNYIPHLLPFAYLFTYLFALLIELGSHSRPCWPITDCVAQAGLELTAVLLPQPL